MKNKNKLMMSGLMALVLGLGITSNVFAYQGDFTQKGPNYNKEFESQMIEVMTQGDYEAWKKLVEEKVQRGRVDEVINKDNFSKFKEAWLLAREGKIKEANLIRKELGLRTSDGQRHMDGSGRGGNRGLHIGNRVNK
jgi:hypothetical protein